jgi:hypothetical protein
VRFGLDVLAALEHQVLEQVREARTARLFVLRSDVIREVEMHDRNGMIFFQHDREAVGERGDLILELRRTDSRGQGRAGHGDRRGRHSNGRQTPRRISCHLR